MSTSISKDVVTKMADLARLQLTNEELTEATKNLEGIFAHFSAIQGIDTANVPTSDDASGLTNVMRADESHSQELASHDELLDQAPQTKNGQVQVKAVFTK
ncbi:MAG: Asp-tRNA(Asn)/Glu-tRNA(Gln) amidotransferase subunit GatC [Candidatus Andersenbacteria bacterium]|nr:Asp-tRNA(Asn)/Glu-tRNA(Gln) amidotransferase subunit GatC [Candidatus Andersenbacteria bacterium]